MGVDSPRAIRRGFRTLSITAIGARRRVRISAHPESIAVHAQMITGTSTGTGPTWTMQNIKTRNAITPDAGTSNTVNMTPARMRLKQRHADHPTRDVADRRSGQIDEVRAAFRGNAAGEALHAFCQSGARPEEKSRDQHRNGESEHAEADAGDLAEDRACRLQQGWPEPPSAASRLLEARLQAAWTRSPINGQSRTFSGGIGTIAGPSRSLSTRKCAPSAKLRVTAPRGPMMITRPASVISMAARPPRPPRSFRKAA